MATGTYAPDPDLHVVDANGVPVPGGLVWTYLAGTITPTPTYTDVGLLAPNTNPIIAGSDGRFVAFLAGGISYKFVYELPPVPPALHGAVLATRDNILAVTTIVPGTGGGVAQQCLLTGTVNDFALVPGCSALYCQNASPVTFTGFSGGVTGQRLTVFAGGSRVNFSHQDGGSLGPNRCQNWVTSAPTPLNGVGSGLWASATFIYLGTWILTAHEQGGWITPPYSASDFYGTGAGTWAVTAGQVVVMKYRVSGRTLALIYQINGTTITGTPTALVIGPGQLGGYTFAGFASNNVASISDQVPTLMYTTAPALTIQHTNNSLLAAGSLNLNGTWFGEVV